MIINHNYCIKLVPLVIFINAVFAGTDSEKSCSVKIWKHLYAGCAPIIIRMTSREKNTDMKTLHMLVISGAN